MLIPIYNSVGFQDNLADDHLDQYKRVRAVAWACDLKYQDCIDNSLKLFKEWMANPTNFR